MALWLLRLGRLRPRQVEFWSRLEAAAVATRVVRSICKPELLMPLVSIARIDLTGAKHTRTLSLT